MSTTVVNIYSFRDNQYPRDGSCVYVGRMGHGEDGYFGSPIKIGSACPECGAIHRDNGSTISCYTAYLKRRLRADPEFRKRVQDLSGKRLVCFCKPKPCHGDVLARAADYLASKEKR